MEEMMIAMPVNSMNEETVESPMENAAAENSPAEQEQPNVDALDEMEVPPTEELPFEEQPPAKPKRTRRKAKAEDAPPAEETEPQQMEVDADGAVEQPPQEPEPEQPEQIETIELCAPAQPRPAPRRRAKTPTAPVLTIESRAEVETEQSREEAAWHEIHNAYRTRRILTGQLGGIEQTEAGKTLAVVDYNGFRVIIPLKEMMITLGANAASQDYATQMLRQNKLLGNMLGAELDFVVKGIDAKTRSVVASRREAMLRKRQLFYFSPDANGMYRVYEGRIVQARVIAVAEKAVRVEVFGVETSILARDLSWDWITDAHERFSVGDQLLVRVLEVKRDSVEALTIRADAKSVTPNTARDTLKKIRVQSKYMGKVTDIHKGVVYLRLANGVNAVAHSCYDHRSPGKRDDVSFVVTKLDEERSIAVGIITRIIRQNI